MAGTLTAASNVLIWAMLMFCGFVGCVYDFGAPAIYRDEVDSVKRAIIITDPTTMLQQDGVVVGWHLYTTRARRSQMVILQIWRPLKNELREHSLVGQTVFVAQWIGHNYIPLFPHDRIVAKKDDVIGLYFPKYNPVPWTATSCRNEGNEHLYKYNPKRMGINKTYIMEKSAQDWEPCRIYSVNATIMTPQEAIDFDQSTATYPPLNNRGLHGKNYPTKMPILSTAPTIHGRRALQPALGVSLLIYASASALLKL